MVDSSFLAFVGVAALLVLSPGATWAVVTDGAIEGGTRGGLWTVAGIGTANFSLATASAFGLSALFHRFPQVLHALAVCGAVYMAWLGVRALRRAWGRREAEGERGTREGQRREAEGGRRMTGASPSTRFGLGLFTNLTNVSVVLFYTVVVPQFIGPRENALARYLLLGETHVAMSIAWMTALALFVGSLAGGMTRPFVRRAMDVVTGVALLGFAAKIALSA